MWIIRKIFGDSSFVTRETQILKESIFDKRTPIWSRIILGVAAAYLFLPFDIVSDLIPILGQIDDIILIPIFIAISYFLVPKTVREDVKRKIEGKK